MVTPVFSGALASAERFNIASPEGEAAWKAWRRTGIGGTAAAAICGTSNHMTRFEAYLALTEGRELEDCIPLELGRYLEPWILGKLEQHLQAPTVRGLCVRHQYNSWMIGSLDAVVLGPDGRPIAGADAKSIEIFNVHEWGTAEEPTIPAGYETQGRYYMAITGLPCWCFPVLVGKDELRFAVVDRNEETEAQMISVCERFWKEHVLPGRPPDIDWTPTARDYLRSRYAESSKRLRPATKGETAEVHAWKRLRQELHELTRKEATAKNRVIEIIGPDDGLKIGAEKVTYSRSGNRVIAPRSWKGE